MDALGTGSEQSAKEKRIKDMAIFIHGHWLLKDYLYL
jgi:hypothetical protein